MNRDEEIKINVAEKSFDIRKKDERSLPSSQASMEKFQRSGETKNLRTEWRLDESEGKLKVFSKIKNSLTKISKEEVKVSDAENSPKNRVSKFLDRTIGLLCYLLVFLLPIFILPFSMEIYEFNKTMLLFTLSSLMFLIWIAKMIIVDRKISIVKTALDRPLSIFIVAILLSTLFSVDKISSILGFYGRYSDSLLVYSSLIMLYFVIVNYAGRNEKTANANTFVNNIVRTFLLSAFIVTIVSLIYSSGIKIIPWSETQFRSFNLIDELLSVLSIYLTAVVLIALYYKSSVATNALSKHSMSILIIMALILLMLADFVLAWIILAFASCSVLILIGVSSRKLLIAPLLIFLVSATFIAGSLTIVNKTVETNFSSSIVSTFVRDRLVLPRDGMSNADLFRKEVILDKNTALSITMEGFKKEPVSGVIGSGPGTYLYNFSKFKPNEFNNNLFWNIRFDRAGSEILEKVSTIGILGALSYLLIVIFTIMIFLKMAIQQRILASARHCGIVYLFFSWCGLLIAQFLYLESVTLKFIFWLLTAVIIIRYYTHEKKSRDLFVLELKKKDSSLYMASAAFVLILGFFSICYNYQFNIFQAEAGYKQAQIKQNEALNNSLNREDVWRALDQGVVDLKNVIEKNPYRGNYKAYLSDIYYTRASFALSEEKNKEGEERDNNKIALEVKNAIESTKEAVDRSPNSIIFQQKSADLYAAVFGGVGVIGADEWAEKKYKRAIELEPSNPVLYTELGKVYILQYVESKSEEKVNQAIGEFEKALELKNNYADAGLQLGLAYEIKGDNKEAINQLKALLEKKIASINSAFQLGRIYYNIGEIDEAKSIFLEIARIQPRNSNARYSLGSVYEKEGNIEAAINEFKIVLSLNPDNQIIKDKIEELEKRIKLNAWTASEDENTADETEEINEANEIEAEDEE